MPGSCRSVFVWRSVFGKNAAKSAEKSPTNVDLLRNSREIGATLLRDARARSRRCRSNTDHAAQVIGVAQGAERQLRGDEAGGVGY